MTLIENLWWFKGFDQNFNHKTDPTISSRAFFDSPLRLPKEVKPVHYDIYLNPNLETGIFQGNVTILVDVMKKRDYIELHQKDLKITSAKLKSYNHKGDVPVKGISIIDKYEKLIVSFNDIISIGKYYLSFEFNGALQSNGTHGFLESSYNNKYKNKRKIAATNFEPTHARRTFPCFDEPSFKALFSVKLVHPTGDGYSALSNMNIESTVVDKPDKGLTTVTFAKSLPMSTYLVCFIVSDFVSVTGSAKKLDNNTFPISIYTTAAQKDEALFALDIGIKLIESYSKMFKIDYPLPKLDMATIPDLSPAAMENFGLITYRENILLYNSEKSSTADKENVAQTIAHELAHMWFGNLVTMQWWNDIWLNEGFAAYMQYISTNSIIPNWGLMDRFLPETLYPAFTTDSKKRSHPIIHTVNDPNEISALFDVISYKKGASVIRMLENFLGTEAFNAGVKTYLNKFAYNNTETADFFHTLQNQKNVSVNITSIMDTWTRQAGYPVVNVIKNNSTHYTLMQKRFLSNPEAQYDPAESAYGYKWTIPVTYKTDKNSEPTLVWFDKDADKLEITLNESVEWIKFNCDQIGFYRVNYSAQEWESLADALLLNHTKLSVSDRASLIEDAFSLAGASELDYTIAMKITLYLGKEHSSVPWSIAADKLLAIDYALSLTNISSKFRKYVRKLVDGPYHNVTWKVDNSEDHDTLHLRPTILNLACAVGHTKCLDKAGVTFRTWIYDAKDTRIHPDIKSSIFEYGMRHVGHKAEWNAFLKKYVDEITTTVEPKFLDGLLSNVNSSFFQFIEDEPSFKRKVVYLLQTAKNSTNDTSLDWNWIRENWINFIKQNVDNCFLAQLIPSIISKFATNEAKLNEVKEFLNTYSTFDDGEFFYVDNIKWLQEKFDTLEKWLDANTKY